MRSNEFVIEFDFHVEIYLEMTDLLEDGKLSHDHIVSLLIHTLQFDSQRPHLDFSILLWPILGDILNVYKINLLFNRLVWV